MSDRLAETIGSIGPRDEAAFEQARAALDAKTKPRGSLGRLEELACRLAGFRGSASPGRLRSIVVVAAADHGVAVECVSAYPQEVTSQMLANFEAGGSAVCVLAREAGAELRVVDVGVGAGTANIAAGPAMTCADALDSVAAGIALAAELEDAGFGVVALGEMGIANSTSASALCAALLQVDPQLVCGRGPGSTTRGSNARSRSSAARWPRTGRIRAIRWRSSPRSGASRSRSLSASHSAPRRAGSRSFWTGSSPAPRRSPQRASRRMRSTR